MITGTPCHSFCWKSATIIEKQWASSTLLLQSTVCVEGPFMALVWCEIFGWCLTESRCLIAGQWHTENQQDTGQTQMHAKLWSVPAHYCHAPACAWQVSVWITHRVFKPLATVSVQTPADYSWTVISLSLPLHGTTRLGTARFAFPLQFSTVLEWAGLFTYHYSCAASTAVTSS